MYILRLNFKPLNAIKCCTYQLPGFYMRATLSTEFIFHKKTMLKNFFLGRYDPSYFPYGLEQNTKSVKRPLVFITRDSNQK